MPGDPTIRRAAASDGVACAAIYAPYVTDTVVSFEAIPPTAEEMAVRIERSLTSHEWLVAEADGRVVGYAYAGPFAGRAAYRRSCETSVYLERGRRRTGAGRALYADLLGVLERRGVRRAMAGMTLPNDASVGLHRAVGFEVVGVCRRVGFKHGAWRDVQWMQRAIGPLDDEPPAEPG